MEAPSSSHLDSLTFCQLALLVQGIAALSGFG